MLECPDLTIDAAYLDAVTMWAREVKGLLRVVELCRAEQHLPAAQAVDAHENTSGGREAARRMTAQ